MTFNLAFVERDTTEESPKFQEILRYVTIDVVVSAVTLTQEESPL